MGSQYYQASENPAQNAAHIKECGEGGGSPGVQPARGGDVVRQPEQEGVAYQL